MTLQYNIRSMSEDRNWQQRIRLSRCLLVEAVDWWCRGESQFPVEHTVASVLYLFSPRCDPFEIRETKIRLFLLNIVGTPIAEYAQTWPHRTEVEKSELIDSISRIIVDAVQQWNDGHLDPSIEIVNQQIVDQLVIQNYVTFHHNQTTRRDFGGYFGSW